MDGWSGSTGEKGKWTVGVAAQERRGSGLLKSQHRREGEVDCWSGGTGEKGKLTVGMAAQERSWAIGLHFVLGGQQYGDILI